MASPSSPPPRTAVLAPRVKTPSRTPSAGPLTVCFRLPCEAPASTAQESAENEPPKESSKAQRRQRRDAADSEDATSDSSDSTGHSQAHRKRARKPTYAIRKEERETLLQEMRLLESRVELLRKAVGLPSLADHSSLEAAETQNRNLENAQRGQLLSLCGGHSILSQYMREQFSRPVKLPIHLGRDLAERRATLLALRRKKLDLGYQFLEKRLQGVDLRQPLTDYQSWISTEGDHCYHRLDINQFEGLSNIQPVWDALVFYSANIEISISEHLGQLTLREDIDCVDTQISHHRILSSTNHGVVMEVNSVCFAEYHEAFDKHNGEPFALMTNDTVDADELYPYCPNERVQKTVHAAVSISSYRKPRLVKDETEGQGELVVVMRRCAYLSIKKPQFDVTPAALNEVTDTVSAWGNHMTKAIHDSVYPGGGSAAALSQIC